ncbi:MAG TPA: deoxyribodipyrimidine photolyase, partial [bacterium]|nr:deoxyribodipyrimidine photolyase [bacterium]
IRPKLARLMDGFLEDFPAVPVRPAVAWPAEVPVIDWERLRRRLRLDAGVFGSGRFRPGGRAGQLVMREFLRDRLDRYPVDRNDPNAGGQSNLSPYLNHGQLSAQRVVLETLEAGRASKASEVFLEELVTRRELAENYCLYNPDYDRPEGFPEWARRSLEKHRADRRRYLYRRPELEAAETHDPIWNTAQRQLAGLGKLHGYLRMYWAKKILEWSPDPEAAQAEAVYLNDRYALDGRDPNGYAGIAWSIGGVHDRPWFERPVYGQVRYMNESGCRRKFNVDRYLESGKAIPGPASRLVAGSPADGRKSG